MPVRCIACAKLFPEKKMVGELCKRCHKQAPERLAKAAEYQQKRQEDMMRQYSGESEVNVNQNTTPAEPTPPSQNTEQTVRKPRSAESRRQAGIYALLGVGGLGGGTIGGFYLAFIDTAGEIDTGMWPGYFWLFAVFSAVVFFPLAYIKYGVFDGAFDGAGSWFAENKFSLVFVIAFCIISIVLLSSGIFD